LGVAGPLRETAAALCLRAGISATPAVAMAGLHLLRRLIEIGESGADARLGERDLVWLVVIQTAFNESAC